MDKVGFPTCAELIFLLCSKFKRQPSNSQATETDISYPTANIDKWVDDYDLLTFVCVTPVSCYLTYRLKVRLRNCSSLLLCTSCSLCQPTPHTSSELPTEGVVMSKSLLVSLQTVYSSLFTLLSFLLTRHTFHILFHLFFPCHGQLALTHSFS